MKKNIYVNNRIKYLMLFFLAFTIFYGCAEDASPVLYNEYKDKGTPGPTAASISPANFAYAGMDTLTITGTNFTDSAHTNVYFNNVKATVISVTSTEIKVKAPNLPGDNLDVRVSVNTADVFAVPLKYSLKAVQEVYYDKYKYTDAAVAITFDREGNLYVSQTDKGAGIGVKKIDLGKNISDYAPKGQETTWSSLKMAYGPYANNGQGQLFGVRKLKGIWKIDPGVAPGAMPWVGGSTTIDQNVNDFDFDPAGNIWAAGAGKNIFRVKADKSVVKYPFATSSSKINAVRVFKDPSNTLYLYIGGTKDGQEGVWRYKIQGDAIVSGSEELYFDFGAAYPGKSVLSLAFSVDGYMYIGTTADETIISVSPSKKAQAFLPGVVMAKFFSFVWDSYPTNTNAQHLIFSRDLTSDETDKQYSPKMFSIVMFKQGAPYYGLELQ
ncbi:MAG: hypothetical protein HF314_14805 [Ignavibacteria bacterium]|jgi:hypothetical protein|nr:hypothetical protein [Ignavibacteria bacterium]MCU7504349.1 hypothetical protein [Ignavibacteria bacterium]MCU7517572.1 hypothetical protein [Ignavibacteria bacterium]